MIFGHIDLSALVPLVVNPSLCQGIVHSGIFLGKLLSFDWHGVVGDFHIILFKYTFGVIVVLQKFKYM